MTFRKNFEINFEPNERNEIETFEFGEIDFAKQFYYKMLNINTNCLALSLSLHEIHEGKDF